VRPVVAGRILGWHFFAGLIGMDSPIWSGGARTVLVGAFAEKDPTDSIAKRHVRSLSLVNSRLQKYATNKDMAVMTLKECEAEVLW